MTTLVDIQNLKVTFPAASGPVDVVKGISFSLGRERLAIVGESGSGKSMTGRSLMGLVPRPGRVRADRMQFEDIDLRDLPEVGFQRLRGARLGLILQDPKFSLNPVMRIGEQLAEALEFHTRLSRRERFDKAAEALLSVRITDPERVMRLYPHEISGGMGQRVMIAMMVLPEPSVLIADEPTSALDVSIRAQVLDILDEQVTRRGMGLILISHDLAMVARRCDRVLVMFDGRIVEECQADRLDQATHPYTRGLLASAPRLGEARGRLPVLDRAALAAAAPRERTA